MIGSKVGDEKVGDQGFQGDGESLQSLISSSSHARLF